MISLFLLRVSLFLFLGAQLHSSAVMGTEENGADPQILLKGGMTPAKVAGEIFPEPEEGVYYSLPVLLKAFESFVHPDLWDDFSDGWGAIYQGVEAGSVKRLSSKRETAHMRCHFQTMMELWPLYLGSSYASGETPHVTLLPSNVNIFTIIGSAVDR